MALLPNTALCYAALMNFVFSPVEARVLGCLIEKERTTPEYYPITINALVNACNQKSNRDPMMSLSASDVAQALDALQRKDLIHVVHTAGARVAKHAHHMDRLFNFTQQEYAILCVLLLRGPQTSGEIRSRVGRMCSFAATSEVESVLQGLGQREDGPFVIKLPRQPGKSSCRFAHLFCGPVTEEAESQAEAATPQADTPPQDDRLTMLEKQVTELRAEMESIKAQLGIAPSQTPDT
ncbi:MAG: hypothetical protein BWY59_01351 [Verrucomicrobia bacterium ADurb.Bin345]|nr:MAG: hypothetical protein BWY59_01351 [Verrucomicrobia bacterium ADurb.Bin345]